MASQYFGSVKTALVYRRDPEEVHALRKAFNSVKHELLDHHPRGYEFHHIIPLSMGGTNDPTNIVLCEKRLHRIIHQFIDEQGEVTGVARRIIPVLPGKIWSGDLWEPVKQMAYAY